MPEPERKLPDLRRLRVRDVCCRALRIVSPDATVSEIRRLFEEKGLHHVVVERGGRIAGIVSDRDLLPLGAAPATRSCAMPAPALASDVMTREVLTIGPGEKLAAALVKMLEHGVHALVVAEGRRALGILTSTDFLTLLLDLTIDDYLGGGRAGTRRGQRAGPARDVTVSARLSRRRAGSR